MPPTLLHAGAHAEPNLPLATRTALSAMAIGLVVLAVVGYDAYRVYVERVAAETDSDHE